MGEEHNPIKRFFVRARQAWTQYQVGRTMRGNKEVEPPRDEVTEPAKAEGMDAPRVEETELECEETECELERTKPQCKEREPEREEAKVVCEEMKSLDEEPGSSTCKEKESISELKARQRAERTAEAAQTTYKQPWPSTMQPLPKGWLLVPGADYPWRLTQPVIQESNWRATWVLEAKDLQAVQWEKMPLHGEAWDVTLLRGHQDDVTAWAGKP